MLSKFYQIYDNKLYFYVL